MGVRVCLRLLWNDWRWSQERDVQQVDHQTNQYSSNDILFAFFVVNHETTPRKTLERFLREEQGPFRPDSRDDSDKFDALIKKSPSRGHERSMLLERRPNNSEKIDKKPATSAK